MLLETISWLALLCGGPEEGVVLVDGREVPGRVTALGEGGLSLEGQEAPIPLYELNAIVLPGAMSRRTDGEGPGAAGAGPAGAAPVPAGFAGGDPAGEGGDIDFDAGPLLRFHDGATLRARVRAAGERVAVVEVDPPGAGPSGARAREGLRLEVPLDAIRAFRLREASRGDQVFEDDMARADPVRLGAPASIAGSGPPSAREGDSGAEGEAPAPVPRDIIYIRRPTGLLRVEGLLQSLDDAYLTLRIEGELRRIQRSLVLGVILAPMASSVVESDVPAVFELDGAGGLPGFLSGVEGEAPRRRFLVRFAGARPSDLQTIPESWLRLVRFWSDRVAFLSALDPVRVEQVPFVGSETSFAWQRDRAAGGGPIRLGGRTYRKGLGVHARNVLEFDLQARYRSLAGVIGLDESAGPQSGVAFRVYADSKEIFTRHMTSGSPPASISLPVDGVRRLRLEVDYGEDGVDFGDFADWADLRVTR